MTSYYRVQIITHVQKTNEYLVDAPTGAEAVRKTKDAIEKNVVGSAGRMEGLVRVGHHEDHTLNCSHTPATADEWANTTTL
jgi:hypothetical protein